MGQAFSSIRKVCSRLCGVRRTKTPCYLGAVQAPPYSHELRPGCIHGVYTLSYLLPRRGRQVRDHHALYGEIIHIHSDHIAELRSGTIVRLSLSVGVRGQYCVSVGRPTIAGIRLAQRAGGGARGDTFRIRAIIGIPPLVYRYFARRKCSFQNEFQSRYSCLFNQQLLAVSDFSFDILSLDHLDISSAAVTTL